MANAPGAGCLLHTARCLEHLHSPEQLPSSLSHTPACGCRQRPGLRPQRLHHLRLPLLPPPPRPSLAPTSGRTTRRRPQAPRSPHSPAQRAPPLSSPQRSSSRSKRPRAHRRRHPGAHSSPAASPRPARLARRLPSPRRPAFRRPQGREAPLHLSHRVRLKQPPATRARQSPGTGSALPRHLPAVVVRYRVTVQAALKALPRVICTGTRCPATTAAM